MRARKIAFFIVAISKIQIAASFETPSTLEVSSAAQENSAYLVKKKNAGLMEISKEIFGTVKYWNKIAALNALTPPYTIYLGSEIKIPQQLAPGNDVSTDPFLTEATETEKDLQLQSQFESEETLPSLATSTSHLSPADSFSETTPKTDALPDQKSKWSIVKEKIEPAVSLEYTRSSNLQGQPIKDYKFHAGSLRIFGTLPGILSSLRLGGETFLVLFPFNKSNDLFTYNHLILRGSGGFPPFSFFNIQISPRLGGMLWTVLSGNMGVKNIGGPLVELNFRKTFSNSSLIDFKLRRAFILPNWTVSSPGENFEYGTSLAYWFSSAASAPKWGFNAESVRFKIVLNRVGFVSNIATLGFARELW